MKQKQALALLSECEARLRDLVAQAVREGDYGAVVQIAEWARAVSLLLSEAQSLCEHGSAPEQAVAVATPDLDPPITGRSASRARRPAADEYPKFFRRSNELVKVGWSKKERREYSHRAPRSAVEAVSAAVRRVGAGGRLFNGDALLPLKDSAGSAIPDYQVYVALAWLKSIGAVEQRGRRAGYTLGRGTRPDSVLTTQWASLQEWRG